MVIFLPFFTPSPTLLPPSLSLPPPSHPLSPSSLPPSAGALAIPRAFFGSAFGRIHLDDLACVGTEDALINCSHGGIQEHNCGHAEDAGAICIGQ